MIINGTTNVILTRMEREGSTLAAALADAQRRGFAEADPSADVDGHDAAAKLLLLSRLAFDSPLVMDDVAVAGIGGVDAQDIGCAALLGGSVKLVASRSATVTRSRCRCGPPWSAPVMRCTGSMTPRTRSCPSRPGGHRDAQRARRWRRQHRERGGVGHRRRRHQPRADSAGAGIVGDRRRAGAVERGGYLRVRLHPVPDASPLVLQALDDRGVTVDASTLLHGEEGAGAQLAVLTAPAAREVLDHAVETLELARGGRRGRRGDGQRGSGVMAPRVVSSPGTEHGCRSPGPHRGSRCSRVTPRAWRHRGFARSSALDRCTSRWKA